MLGVGLTVMRSLSLCCRRSEALSQTISNEDERILEEPGRNAWVSQYYPCAPLVLSGSGFSGFGVLYNMKQISVSTLGFRV